MSLSKEVLKVLLLLVVSLLAMVSSAGVAFEDWEGLICALLDVLEKDLDGGV